MIFRARFLEGIREGRVTVAFRRWVRPSVKAGGTLLTPVGQLGIAAVTPVRPEQISEADARRAGYESRATLVEDLDRRGEGDLYRIDLGPLGPDPRIALRVSAPEDAAEVERLRERLRRLDARANEGPWTLRVLEVIGRNPGVRAGSLCRLVGQEKLPFKVNVRKLKTLGLTESLETGYRLSPRGNALLAALRKDPR